MMNAFLVRSSLVVMAILFVNKIAGFVKLLMMTRTFGTGPAADAYAAANQLPELLFAMLAGGALTAAFIPVYSASLVRGDRGGASRLLHTVVTLTIGGFGGICLIAALAAPAIVSDLLVPSFGAAEQQLTAELMQILLLATAIFAVGNAFTGALNAHQHFLSPAVGTVMVDIGHIFGLAALAPRLGIVGVAWGSVVGAVLSLLVQVPSLARRRIGYRPQLDLKLPATRHLLTLMGPRVVALGAGQAVDLVLIRLASGMPSGSISAYFYALLVIYVPRSLFALAVGTVIFPTLAEEHNRGDRSRLRRTTTDGLAAVLAFTIPAAIGLIALGKPGVRFLFPGGRLDAAAVEVVYALIVILAVRLVAESAQDVLFLVFYAEHNTRLPMWLTLGWMVTNIGLSILLASPFGIRGLAWASSLAAVALTGALLFFVWQVGGGVERGRLGLLLLRVLAASGPMAVCILLLHRLNLGTVPFLVTALVSSVVVYGGLLYLFSGRRWRADWRRVKAALRTPRPM